VAAVNDRSRISLVVIGLLAFAGGVLLMIRHKREIEEVYRTETRKRQLQFEKRKFRRRSIASAMIASMGILMTSLVWAREPAVFAGLISVVLILLLAVMFLAFLDLMLVSLHTVGQNDDSARKKLVNEYLQQRKRLDEQQAREGDDEPMSDHQR
jgi:ABC-type transport system involved in cytochrome bd biosynthesis fused ATPase/permease subunit